MRQTPEAVQQHLAERLCWQAAYRDDCFDFLQELGVGDWLGDIPGTAIPREMVPIVQDVLLDGLKTRLGIERRPALPAVRFSDEALMRLVGCNAQQVRQGVCQRGAAKRPGPRTTGPIGPEALADTIVKVNLRDLGAMLNHVIHALAQAGIGAAKVTGLVEATDLETTAAYEGGGQVTRQRRITDTRGRGMRSRSRALGGS